MAIFKNTNLNNADLNNANLRYAINVTSEQVKVVNNWDKAEYNPELRQELGLS
ncbi:MAG: pentapeptide repeat-containing protein [Rivularia sp. (in: cyanobacteria)]